MAFSVSNDYITGVKSVPTATGGETLAVRFTLALDSTATDSNGDIGRIGILPKNHLPFMLIVDSDALDPGSTCVMSIGLLDTAGTALDTSAAAGGAAQWDSTISTVIRTGGNGQTIATKPMQRVTSSNSDRYIGLKVTTAATTPTAGTIGVTLLYRAAPPA